MFQSIKTRFIFFSISLIIFSVGIPSVFLMNQFKDNFQQRSEIMLKTMGDVIYNCVRYSMLAANKNIEQIVTRYTANPNIEQIRFFDRQGIITYASHDDQVNHSIFEMNKNLTPEALQTAPIINQDISTGMVSIIKAIPNDAVCSKCHGQSPIIGYLNVESRMTQAETYFYTGSLHIIMLAIVIIILISLGFLFLFNRFINSPLHFLIRAMDKVKAGDLSTRLPADEESEFGVVYRQFNFMTEHLQQNRREIDAMHFDQLQHADKLVTLGELAAEMAHEINNPIGVIMTRADYLTMEAEDNQFLRAYLDDLQAIQNQVSRISAITGNIMKYGKKLPKNYKEFNLFNAVEESLNILSPHFKKRRIKISRDLSVNNPMISGDQQQIEQVLINLFNNATDAMEGGGELMIRAREADADKICLEVTDTGSGIPEEQIEQIFTPFFSTKGAERGTGLGLYIVQKIVRNHGGTLSCKSKLGEGTTFYLTFNRNKES